MKSSLVVLSVLTAAVTALAGEFRFESAGFRGGFGAGGNDTQFSNYEAFGKADLPWRWAWGSDWGLQTGLDFSAGILQRNSETAFMGQVGPSFTIGSPKFPVAFELGSNPTVLSTHSFDRKDLGSWFQFTSYAGLRVKLWEHYAVGYRFQHTSNAGLGEPNPGLNMHSFALSYRF